MYNTLLWNFKIVEYALVERLRFVIYCCGMLNIWNILWNASMRHTVCALQRC